jgi:hypothetical protein
MPDSENTPTPRGLYIGRLDTVGRVRRELVKLYKAARRGELDIADASKLGNLLFLAARLLEGQELEARVARLEQAEPRREPWR